MRIQVNDEKRLAIIWLTNNDQADPEQQQKLQSLYREYSAKKYTVAMFQSGQEDLAALTSHLLCHNRVYAAKAELRQAKQERKEQEAEQEKERAWQPPKRQEMYQGPTMTL